jgi:hypothetical protein
LQHLIKEIVESFLDIAMNKNGCCVLNSALNCAKEELKERNVPIKKYFWVCLFFFFVLYLQLLADVFWLASTFPVTWVEGSDCPPHYGATVFFFMSPLVSLIWTSRFLYLMIISFEPIIIQKNYVWLLFNDWMLNSASLFWLMLWFLLFSVCCFYCLSIMDPLIAW